MVILILLTKFQFFNMKKFKSLLPPGLSKIGNKLYVVPGWIEVPSDTTQKWVMENWEETLPKPAPGRNATTKEIESYLAGTYEHIIEPVPLDKEFKIVSSNGVKAYTVNFKNNSWSCNCVGYGFRGKCRHIEAAKKL